MKFCPYCAEAIQDDARFCPFCGSNLAKTLAAVPIPPTREAPQAPRTSGMATASMICGIFFFILPLAILAIVFGHLSSSEINRSLGRIRGKGMALAGLILGYVGVAFIPFVLIIAAIAIPNLLRAKQAANEASAVGALRSYSYATGAYAAKCPNIGFPKSLANLGIGPGDCQRAQLLYNSLGTETPIKSGYRFRYVPAQPDDLGQVTGFAIHADPLNPGTSLRHFYIDQTGIIRWNNEGSAEVVSPVIR